MSPPDHGRKTLPMMGSRHRARAVDLGTASKATVIVYRALRRIAGRGRTPAGHRRGVGSPAPLTARLRADGIEEIHLPIVFA
jgi:hypothetical protein